MHPLKRGLLSWSSVQGAVGFRSSWPVLFARETSLRGVRDVRQTVIARGPSAVKLLVNHTLTHPQMRCLIQPVRLSGCGKLVPANELRGVAIAAHPAGDFESP